MIECPFRKKYPDELVRDHTYFMSMAYNQAIEAWRRDEVPIGAVIEMGGKVIASAYNQVETLKDPTAHAEMLAITKAANAIADWRLNQATLYVTKEPCPMCSGACIMARIKKVHYAVSDPKMGYLGGAMEAHLLDTLNHRLHVEMGPMEFECKQLLQSFFQMKRLKLDNIKDVEAFKHLWN
ncbi:MAG: nucleoside deaminase [Verrucomicrobiota bacterium]